MRLLKLRHRFYYYAIGIRILLAFVTLLVPVVYGGMAILLRNSKESFCFFGWVIVGGFLVADLLQMLVPLNFNIKFPPIPE